MNNKIIGESLTFDDVLLVPRKSEVLPNQVEITTRLTKTQNLKLPLLSAAMDTVSEAEMAIAVAREGGVGIIHRNLPIEKQASEVLTVKRAESGLIRDPITLTPEAKVEDALRLMNKYHISGIPILEGRKLVGIITHRDLRFRPVTSQPVREIMTKDKLITAKIGVTMEEAEQLLQRHRIEKLPIVDDKGNLYGLITFRDIQNQGKFPNSNKDGQGRLMAGAAVGVSGETFDRAAALIEAGADVLVVDTAHGHSAGVLKTVAELKKRYPAFPVIGGNIATAEAAAALRDAGADAVKVGVGPGSICTTRVIAGVGVAQLSAVMDCAEVLQGEIPIIADGGVRYSGDIAKAIAAGADAVMIGSLFAGCKESPGDTVLYEGRSYKVFRGMGSLEAMKEGSKDRYFQDSVQDAAKLVPEGVTGRVPYKGEVSSVIYQLAGGLRASMGYCGAKDIREMQENAKFVRITAAGVRESHPHDIHLISEAPNYEVRQ